MTYLGSPRFQVRELEGYWEPRQHGGGGSRPGLSVTVIDRAYCYQVIAQFRSDDQWKGPGSTRDDARLRRQATELCAELNARVADAQADCPVSGTDLPSLSPFDSGCPR